MAPYLTTGAQLELLSDIRRTLREVCRQEHELPAEHHRRLADIRARFAELQQQEKSRVRRLEMELRGEYLRLSSEAVQEHDHKIEKVNRELALQKKQLNSDHRKLQQELEYELYLASRQLKRDLEAGQAREKDRHRRELEQLSDLLERIVDFRPVAESVLYLRGLPLPDPVDATGELPPGEPRANAEALLPRAEQALQRLLQATVSRAVDQHWFVAAGVISLLVLAAVMALITRSPADFWTHARWGVASLLVVISGRLIIGTLAKRAAQLQVPPILAMLATAQRSVKAANEADHERHRQTLQNLLTQAQQDLATLRQRIHGQQEDAEQKRAARVTAAEQRAAQQRREIGERLTSRNEGLRRQFLPPIDQAKRELTDQLQRWERDCQQELRVAEQDFAERWGAFRKNWQVTRETWEQGLRTTAQLVSARFPDWTATDWRLWRPVEAVPDATFIPWGEYHVPLGMLGDSVPQHDDLRWDRDPIALPETLALPDSGALLLEYSSDAGQSMAGRTLQAVALRTLTAFPAGQMRLTIIDPRGLGENFSGFMHLRDYDDRLLGSRIWTEPQQIDQALLRISEHIENVIQHYLRNEYADVMAYNRQVGDVAVPFQLLIISGFPENFSEEACRWLSKILTTGPRCGVMTLFSVDRRSQLPRQTNWEQLKSLTRHVVCRDETAQDQRAELSHFPLQLVDRPQEPLFSHMIHAIGRSARQSQRVELAFEVVAPSADRWWQGSSETELAIPIGRAAANRLQYLRLGTGTSQHVLIAGKTGSGKSSLLHALITNAALHYSPDELQFYLMDFKKGVEFKAYAEQQLPHARVIAIESEREFGLSVLERLDRELQRRGELYRQVGAQSVADYRAARPQERLPRLLLVVDEFQELFVSEDRLASDAGLLLDRLVRQGRAFGMHVVLGTQTLAGAYSLARSTLGQMTVRIALQCSAVDAHLILSDENEAARMLTRPGEAILNDANGLPEANSEFQVVWLPGDKRAAYLRQIERLAREHSLIAEPPIVFEGSASANIADNVLLRRTLQAPQVTAIPLAPRGWLGEAIAIKEPPAAVFQRRSGSHLLLVGTNSDGAQGVLLSCLTGLSAFMPPAELWGPNSESRPEQTHGKDAWGTSVPADSDGLGLRTFELVGPELERGTPDWDAWQAWMRSFQPWAQFHSPAAASAVVQRVQQLVARRRAANQTQLPPVYLILNDLQHLSSLKQAGDDYAFGNWDEKKQDQPSKWLEEVLRDGPTVGVHVVAWADSYYRAKEFFERSALREFGMRVLFQMNALDSTQLTDSPEAHNLGPHRAILYRESDGNCERFRPYALPTPSWISQVGASLQARNVLGSPSE